MVLLRSRPAALASLCRRHSATTAISCRQHRLGIASSHALVKKPRMLIIDDLSVRVAGRLLIDHATVRVPAGQPDRPGWAATAAARSTLFNVITGEMPSETGHVEVSPRWTVGRLAQEAPDGPESLLDVVLKAATERTALLEEAEHATDPHRIADIPHAAGRHRRAYWPVRGPHAILSGLGFRPDDQARTVPRVLSGGWRNAGGARGRGCSASPTCCCSTSRPTISTSKARSGCRSISRAIRRPSWSSATTATLLDTSVNFILSLEGTKLTLYKGGYSDFRAAAQRAPGARPERWREAGGAAQASPGVRRPLQAKASKASQAQSRVKMLEKMVPIASITSNEVLPIRIPAPDRLLSPPIIAVDDVTVGYEPGRPVLARPVAAHRQRRPHRAAGLERQRQVDAGQADRRPAGGRSRAP